MALRVGRCRRRRDAGSLTGWGVLRGLGRVGGGASARRGGDVCRAEVWAGFLARSGSPGMPSLSTPVRLSGRLVAAEREVVDKEVIYIMTAADGL